LYELGGPGGSASVTGAEGGSGYMSDITGTMLEYSCGGNSTTFNDPVPPFNYNLPYYSQPYWGTNVKTSSSGYGTGGSALRYYNSIGEKQGCIIVKFNYP